MTDFDTLIIESFTRLYGPERDGLARAISEAAIDSFVLSSEYYEDRKTAAASEGELVDVVSKAGDMPSDTSYEDAIRDYVYEVVKEAYGEMHRTVCAAVTERLGIVSCYAAS